MTAAKRTVNWVALGTAALSTAFSLSAAPFQRVANTTLRVPEVPGAFGYTLTDAFPGLVFNDPVAIVVPPGETNRIFVVERAGRIVSVPDLQAPTRTVFLDLTGRIRLDSFNEMGLLGLTFHPDFARNGRFFVFYTTTASTPGHLNFRHDRLSEFRVVTGDPTRGDAASEQILFQQADDYVNHNGGDLHFGSDGYLYVSLGDEGNRDDSGDNSQRIDRDFFAGILRLDVDQRPGNLPPNLHPGVVGNYLVPADNPFVGRTQFNGRPVTPASVRTEFWSVGLRNPWRMAFDALTGELWVGDVGQDRREGVVLASRGSNHGWPFLEHDINGPRVASLPVGFKTDPAFGYVPPVWTYGHGSGTTQGNSITGGRVYRGTRLASLYGAYVFADYVTGNVWALRRPGTGAAQVERLTGQAGFSAFGEDPRNGDLLVANHSTDRILRLVNNLTFTGDPLPETLSATGAFADLATLQPQPGIVPYELNTPFWSDGAAKQRWFSVPDPAKKLGFELTAPWVTPPGTVWIKHFEIELTNGVPASRRRLETRFLVRQAGGVHGFTYRWNAAQTDAVLVGEAGETEVLNRVVEGASTPLTWRYPSRSECLFCHSPAAGQALGFNTAQLNRSVDFGDGPQPFIAALASAGYFSNAVPAVHTLPRTAAPSEAGAHVAWRARSWIEANCASCHRPEGLGGGTFDARIAVPLEAAGLIGVVPVGGAEDPADRLVAPGDPAHSMLLQRLGHRGPGQMPPLATDVVDPAGVSTVEEWIRSLAKSPPVVPVQLEVNLEGDQVRLRANQPAGVLVQFQVHTGSIAESAWELLDHPANAYFIPSDDRVREVVLPTSETEARYFRALVVW